MSEFFFVWIRFVCLGVQSMEQNKQHITTLDDLMGTMFCFGEVTAQHALYGRSRRCVIERGVVR